MTMGKQWTMIKENWLIVLVVLFLLGAFVVSGLSMFAMMGGTGTGPGAYADSIAEVSYARSNLATKNMIRFTPYEADFAPEVEERLITKTARLATEVERGTFDEAEDKLKSIIGLTDSYLLRQDVSTHGKGSSAYKRGRYVVKIEAAKYDDLIAQLKELGEVGSFNENTADMTGAYTDMNIELKTEKERLGRFKEMYEEAGRVEDKINLNDRIFNQERKIKYLENRIDNLDMRVSYSTIHLTLEEEGYKYADVMFVEFSALVSALIDSVNMLIYIFVVLLPWAIAAVVIWQIVRFVKRR